MHHAPSTMPTILSCPQSPPYYELLDAYFYERNRRAVFNFFVNASNTRFYVLQVDNPAQNTGTAWCNTCFKNGPGLKPSLKCRFFDTTIRRIIYEQFTLAAKEAVPPTNKVLRNRIITIVKDCDTFIPTCIYDKLHIMLPTNSTGPLDIRALTDASEFDTPDETDRVNSCPFPDDPCLSTCLPTTHTDPFGPNMFIRASQLYLPKQEPSYTDARDQHSVATLRMDYCSL